MSVKGAVMVPHPPLIVPEIGRGEERKYRATVDAYHQAARKIAQWKPDTVVVISPHSVMYADYFHISPGKGTTGNFARFRVPQVKFGQNMIQSSRDFWSRRRKREISRPARWGNGILIWITGPWCRSGFWISMTEITGWSGSACPVCPWPYIMNWDSASGRRRNLWTGVLRSSEAAICPIS